MDFLGTCQVSKAEVQPALAARARTWAEFSPLNCGFVTLAKGETFGGYHQGHKFVKVFHHLWDKSGFLRHFFWPTSWIM